MWPGEPPGPAVRTRRKFRGAGTGEISEEYVERGNWPEKARASAPRGTNTRGHRAFFASPRRNNSRRPPHRNLEYLYPPTYPPVMHLRFAPSPPCPIPQLPLPRLLII